MKLALIPPFSYLPDTARTDYQLMLPHLVSHPEYEKTYLDLCADNSQFVILDNGVAEGKKIEFKDILDIADRFGVDEVVLPDVMGDCIATMNAASRAIYVHGMHYPIGFMYVVQGQTYAEVMMSAKFALSFSSVRTLGIPRHLIETLGDEDARWRIADRIQHELWSQMENRALHFLGMNPTAPREMEGKPNYLARLVRGFDTSAPYNFAYYATAMDNPHPGPCKRPKRYFELPEKEFEVMTVYRNIEYLERCAE